MFNTPNAGKGTLTTRDAKGAKCSTDFLVRAEVESNGANTLTALCATPASGF
jgi:hypothetical protein